MVNSELASTGARQAARGRRPDIGQRSLTYALRAIKLYQFLQSQKNGAAWIVGKQYLRSATSIGASIEESQASESRADFIHKLGIAQKEARESLYWLRLLSEGGIVAKRRIEHLMQETNELVAIITAIIVNCKRRRAR
ncbi:MAG TPA: four helix bundle protein [Terriglobia bacterium]|nr:four helix bundle protein [Terriglobia bacterium]